MPKIDVLHRFYFWVALNCFNFMLGFFFPYRTLILSPTWVPEPKISSQSFWENIWRSVLVVKKWNYPRGTCKHKRPLFRQAGECSGCLIPSHWRKHAFPGRKRKKKDSKYEESLIRVNDIDYMYYTEVI